MKSATGSLVVRNGTLIDGTGRTPVSDAVVHSRDGRITYAGPRLGAPVLPPDTPTIDAKGGTILPGLVEAHFHPTYFDVAALEDLDIKYPVEYVTLLAAANARLALECGYTSARSGGSLFNIDVWLRKAIEADVSVGPRLSPSGREICGVGGLMDWNPDFRKIGMEGLVLLINGPVEARAAVRKLVKDGVEWVKTYPTGDAAAPDTNDHHTLCMTFEEMHAVVQTAHNHSMKVTGHCRATEGIKNALRAGYDAVEHATFIDDEGLELLLARNVPVVPALQFEWASIERGKAWGMSQRVLDGHKETLAAGKTATLTKTGCTPAEATWKRGVDVLSLGATKNGALCAEAVVFFDPARARDFERRRKQAGHLWSKLRFVSAQWLAYFDNGLWLDNARHANAMASILAEGLRNIGGASLLQSVDANEVFVALPEGCVAALERQGFGFYRWPLSAAPTGVAIRLVTSYAMPRAQVDDFLAAARSAARG